MKLNRVLGLAAITLFASASFAVVEVNVKTSPAFEQQFLLSPGQSDKIRVKGFAKGDVVTCRFVGDKGFQLSNFKGLVAGNVAKIVKSNDIRSFSFDAGAEYLQFNFANKAPGGKVYSVEVANASGKDVRLMVVCETYKQKENQLVTTMPF